jgi:lipopolysaccharide export system permease protein
LRTLHRYLIRQIIATLLMTGAVFTFVLLLGNVLRDVLPLLLNQQATLGSILMAFALLIPWIWVFALPMGMLTATLLVFGRFSADQELTASRASGVSLISLITPILLLSLLLCGLSAAVNLEIAPRCRVAFNNLQNQMKSTMVNLKLPEGQFLDFPGFTIWFEKRHKDTLRNVLIFQGVTNTQATIHAPEGTVERDETNQVIRLHLHRATVVFESSGQPMYSSNIDFELNYGNVRKAAANPKITDMTLRELRDELRDVERRLSSPLDVKGNPTEDAKKKKISAKKKFADPAEPIRVEIQKRMVFSLACFSFTLLGIPLGIRAHRRETNIGFLITIILVMVYYSLILFTASFSARAELIPHLLIWIPNFIFQAAGAVLLWRANRGL